MEPVVVGVDGTLASIGALDLAADEAMGRVVPLVVVYTVEPPLDPSLPQHRRLLDLAVSRAAADHPGLSVSGDLVPGTPVDALIAWSRRASLVVVGHGRGTSPSVAEQVARRSVAPVIVYRPYVRHDGSRPRPVLVGIDGADHGRAAVPFAFAEAALRGVPLTAVHVGGWTDEDNAALVGASRDAALVVIGGHSGGTVSHALIEDAGCPVAVVD